MRTMYCWPGFVVALACATLSGCSRSASEGFRVSGSVTFDGQPVPSGEVLFTPDGSQKNSGPQGIAKIRNGKFDTGASGGKGIAGGATIIRVSGMGGPDEKALCDYEMKADLPRGDTAYDISVPKEAGVTPGSEP